MFKEFRHKKCPICGHNDWCASWIDKDSMIVCKRGRNGTSKDDIVSGFDGNTYICVGLSKSNNYVFQEVNAANACVSKSSNEAIERPSPIVINPVNSLDNETLDRIYRSMASHLILEPYHRDYLLSEGWTDKMLRKYNVVSFPEKDFSRYKYRKTEKSKNPYRKSLAKMILQDLGNPKSGLKGVPGAYLKNDEWTFAGPSGIIFWLFDQDNRMYRARIRMDFRDMAYSLSKDFLGREYFVQDETTWYRCMKGVYQLDSDGTRLFRNDGNFKGKYRNLASFHQNDEEYEKNNCIVNDYKSGCESGNNLGFYFNPDCDDMNIFYVTEGEKKGAFSNHMMKTPFITLPGVDSWSLLFRKINGESPVNFLKRMDCNIIIVAFDADKATNNAVLEKERVTVDKLKQEGFVLGVAEWDISLGKGLDDLLAAGYKPTFTLA